MLNLPLVPNAKAVRIQDQASRRGAEGRAYQAIQRNPDRRHLLRSRVDQGEFKSKDDLALAASSLDHLSRYLELLFSRPVAPFNCATCADPWPTGQRTPA
jgi:hypothetical protein